MTDFKFT